jgi:hypothetical protein
MFQITFSSLSKFKLEYLKLSFLRSVFRDVFSSEGQKLSLPQSGTSVPDPVKDIIKDTLTLNMTNEGEPGSSKGKGKATYDTESIKGESSRSKPHSSGFASLPDPNRHQSSNGESSKQNRSNSKMKNVRR